MQLRNYREELIYSITLTSPEIICYIIYILILIYIFPSFDVASLVLFLWSVDILCVYKNK